MGKLDNQQLCLYDIFRVNILTYMLEGYNDNYMLK